MRLLDGPAEGEYRAARCPIYVRAVVREHDGKIDVLDLIEDEPEHGERVYVYVIVPGSQAHVCIRGAGMCR